MPNYYRLATHIIAPFLPLWLAQRKARGKEDSTRINERYGIAGHPRPKGQLLWIHAASVGEANSVLRLIFLLKNNFPRLHILLTTGTVTSAKLMAKNLPQGVLHQYAPIDTPQATKRFIRHWLPDIGWFVESELWPNLIDEARKNYCTMALINARMSQKTFAFWQQYPVFSRQMLSAFSLCFAQSAADATRLKQLGAANVLALGNLKYDAMPLACDEAELLRLKKATDGRVGWLAASTHPGEELKIAKAHVLIQQQQSIHHKLLTIIVPRHPDRGEQIAREISHLGKVALRSKSQPINADIQFYIADTLGELGLFYRLSEIVFMGGSLVSHGGQNPLEPARLGCGIISGSHTHNFSDIYLALKNHQACITVENETELAETIGRLISNYSLVDALQTRAKLFVEENGGVSEKILEYFNGVFVP